MVGVMDTASFKAARKRRSWLVGVAVRLVKEKPVGVFGAVVTLLLLLTGILAPVLAPYGYNDTSGPLLAPPSQKYLLGTDNLGRDLFTRIIYGARISVIIGLGATALSTLISMFIGVLSAYRGGVIDLISQRFVDAWMCFPGMILLLVMVSILGPGIFQIIIVLSLAFGIGGSRVIRSAVIAIKEETYIKAAVAYGCTDTRVMLRHILPNIMAPIIIVFSTRIPGVILAEASMSFLGLGVPPPEPSWGGMLSGAARRYMFMAPGLAIYPGLALSIVVFGVNMFGDALRDVLDPKLRGGVGRFDRTKKKKGG